MIAKLTPKEFHPFFDSDVFEGFSTGIEKTLKQMAEIDIDFDPTFETLDWKPPTEYSVFLNVESEPHRGQIRFHFERKTTLEIIKKLTGLELDSDEDIIDGLGEIANMFYGTTKTKLNNMGFKFKMSLPQPYLTKNLPDFQNSQRNVILPINIFNEKFYAEIIV